MENEKDREYLRYLNFLKENPDYCMGCKLEEIAAKKPDFPAFIYKDKSINYGLFDEKANKFACFFSSKGIKKGDVVALLMKNSPDYLAMVVGLSRLGAVAALIITDLKEEKLAEDISLSEPRMVVVGEEFTDAWEKAKDFTRLRYPGTILFYPQLLADLPSQADKPEVAVKNFEPFVYLYTAAGFSGRKVVPLNHFRWLLTAETVRIYADLASDEIGYTCIPFWLNSGFSGAFAAMMASESTLVLAPDFSVSSFWKDADKYKTTYFLGTGQMFKYLYSQEPSDLDKKHGVKKVLSNGMAADLFIPFKERFNIEHIIEIYGTTENVGILINLEERPGMCGCLNLAGLRLGEVVRYDKDKDRIIFDDNGYAVKSEVNETGVLLLKIGEYSGFEGYINNFEETDIRIMRSVFEKGDRYFNTRDLVRLHEDDYIEFVQRLDDVYRWKGKTISAHQVADIIKKFFGPIDDALVVGIDVKGYEGRAGLAVIKLIEGEKLNWGKFVSHLKNHLPRYEIPSFIRISRTDKGLRKNKSRYIEEGFNPDYVKEELFVFDAEKEEYTRLTREVYEAVLCHKIRL
ncbi:AMP-binding protein [Thermosyntropha sp.]|uniref:AMP-binding protein n=1 Tax=Thermosyntropha sp. TaxID=2740820 RepID=UPI0025CEF213|nr:AMP-binding protein [Thermosyntropha sp.]MBO8158155.1 AMP-binding protein [Thermosyntropha sp.]